MLHQSVLEHLGKSVIAAESLTKMSSDCIALWSIEAIISGKIGLFASSAVDFLLVFWVLAQNGDCRKKALFFISWIQNLPLCQLYAFYFILLWFHGVVTYQ